MTALLLLLTVAQQGQSDQDLKLPPMPIPNAFHSYESAISAIIGGQTIMLHLPLYMALGPNPRVPAPLATAVQRSQDAFVWIKKGLSQIYRQPVTSLARPPEPFAKNQQLLGKLLMASGDVHADRGEIKEAVSDFVDLMKFGNQLVNAGEGTSPIVGINMMEHARGSLWRLSTKMDYNQLADVTALFKQFAVGQRPYSALLGREERMMLFRLADLAKRPNIIFAIYEKLGIDPYNYPPELAPEHIRSLTRSQLREDCISFFDGWLERTSKEYSRRGKPPTYEQVAQKRDPMSAYMAKQGIMVPATNDFYWYVFLRNQAANAAAAGAFATRAYLKKEGKMPKAFEDFGPSLLATLPPDPFAYTGKIKATFTESSASFRSMGPSLDPTAPTHSLIPSAHPDPKGEFEKEGPLEWVVEKS